jgi:hypothetical protein
MPPTLHEATGLSIAWGPNIASSPYLAVTKPAITGVLTDEIESYRHRKKSFLGDDSAEIEFFADLLPAEDWFEKGLGRHVIVRDPYIDKVWMGFVNEVEIHIGAVAMVRGPLMDMANRVTAIYAEWDVSVDPPVQGERTPTTTAQDLDSQRTYGIIEKYLSAGMSPQAQAEQIRDSYLQEHKQPEATQDISDQAGGDGPTVRLNCLGYGHWFNAYIYTDATAGYQILSNRLESIIANDPNGIFSTDYAEIEANPLLIYQYEFDYPTAFNAVQELVSVGDVADNRYILKIEDDFRVYYQPAPKTISYRRNVSENHFYNIARSDILPWRVEPANWYKIDGFLVGTLSALQETTGAALREDPRNVFIEELDFRAPYELNVQGVKINRLEQKLNKLGMRGVSA